MCFMRFSWWRMILSWLRYRSFAERSFSSCTITVVSSAIVSAASLRRGTISYISSRDVPEALQIATTGNSDGFLASVLSLDSIFSGTPAAIDKDLPEYIPFEMAFSEIILKFSLVHCNSSKIHIPFLKLRIKFQIYNGNSKNRGSILMAKVVSYSQGKSQQGYNSAGFRIVAQRRSGSMCNDSLSAERIIYLRYDLP